MTISTAKKSSLEHTQRTITPASDALRVIKRNGTVCPFDASMIENALKKAFIATEGDTIISSERITQLTSTLAKQVAYRLTHRPSSDGLVHIEAIQDLVELALMRSGEHKVARAYVLYREQRRKQRTQEQTQTTEEIPSITITLDNQQKAPLDTTWLHRLISTACDGLSSTTPETIYNDTMKNLFDGVNLKDLFKALTLSARTLIETEVNYSYVTARLFLADLYHEALTGLDIEHNYQEMDISALYTQAFKSFIQKGIELNRLDPQLNDFDLEMLSQALHTDQDHNFTYLSIQTLYDRYFIHNKEIRIELPQVFFMRIAMGLAHCEGDQRNEKAIEFYNLISSFDYMSSTPTLFNSGTNRSQLSSCYLSTVPDDLDGIYSAIKDNALLSKFAGGLGNDWTPVRAMGSRIEGTNGKSLGVVPFLNVADASAIAVNQGGKRKGAACAYLETWHMDIEEFLDLRKNTGDDRRRTHDMNTANWVPDLLLKRVFENKDWTLFSPNETPELHDLFGDAFEEKYQAYEALAKTGEIQSRSLPAVTLWRKMLGLLFETGHPWITFKDPCNIRSPQQHAGVVHSSNLCTEITLNTSADEIAVCNLGSINLAQHIVDGQLDMDKLASTVKTAIRMLDNVIDINYYSVPQAKNSNLKHRPIGLGLMGFQDALYKMRIPYASEEAVKFADTSMEAISYYAITASAELAQERGTYQSFTGSLWDQGILPIDSIEKLQQYRGKYLTQNTDRTLDWDTLRKKVKKGMRNSNVMAIAPTATISNICGVTQSIEPTYENLYVKSNLSGEFTVANTYLVDDLKAIDAWDTAMIHDLKYYNGSVNSISRIPDDLKALYATAFEIEPKWIIEAASRRQKWIDQAQSLNLYMAEPSGKKLDIMYRNAWLQGLKTTYYLRSLGATNTEKATITDNRLNAVSAAPKTCSIYDPDCEACQ